MTRYSLLVSLLCLASTGCSVGCSSESKASAPPAVAEKPTRNLVCERWAILNPKAICQPELSGHGDLSTHTARVTIDKDTIACALNAGQVSLVCAALVYQPAQQPPATQPAPKAAAKKAAK